jgi:iron(III) transport system ATP-binding protein
MAEVRIERLSKSYGAVRALDGVDLTVHAGAFFTLLGPSGCGKTTLLRAIAGFHRQDGGQIRVGERAIGDLPAHQRDVGMVFQDYAVFPHLSVADNVAFGLHLRKLPAAEVRTRVGEVLETVQLGAHAERMPHQLSGGQQQRVGLARALAIRPQVLLMDEPLSNLDAQLRVDLRRDIRALQQANRITTIYVTHDQEEALAISDAVCVMSGGRVQQVGAPWTVYHSSVNRFVASFVGAQNFLDVAAPAAGEVTLLGQRLAAPPGVRGAAVAAVRPEKLRLDRGEAASDLVLDGQVRQAMFTGREEQLRVDVGGTLLEVILPAEAASAALRVGHGVRLRLAPADIAWFEPGPEGRRLA